MRWVEPQVFKIAETGLNSAQIGEFLSYIGASDWLGKQPWATGRPADPAATLIEISGRACYKSFGTELNPNITKIREDPKDYLANILKKGDGSVLEHAQVSWALVDVSRVFTHELVRHRAGTAVSQESLRYVRPKDLRMTLVPGSELSKLAELDELAQALEANQEEYLQLANKIFREEMSFDEKKVWTSALRRILPDGIATTVIWTANHRTMRWVLEMRTAPSAEVEMRYVFDKLGQILVRDYPWIYQDFVRTPHKDGVGGQWVPKLRSKV